MNIIPATLVKTLVKPFYRQNAGFFLFLFTILFGAVGVVDGAGILEFHYSLIRGSLSNTFLFLLVLFFWYLYAGKAGRFVINKMKQPDHRFTGIIFLLERKKLFFWLTFVQVLLLLPVLIYALIICITGIFLKAFFPCIAILIYLPALIFAGNRRYAEFIKYPFGTARSIFTWSVLPFKKNLFWGSFLRYILIEKKLLYSGIKIFNCVILSMMIIRQLPVEYDMKMIFIFFSLGVIGHGLLIHDLRAFEEDKMHFYRGLPVSLISRFSQYAFLYFILLIPEITILVILSPRYIHRPDAFLIFFFGYTILLFLHCVLYLRPFQRKQYMKIVLGLFFCVYLFILTNLLPLFCIMLLVTSLVIFFKVYYAFENSLPSRHLIEGDHEW